MPAISLFMIHFLARNIPKSYSLTNDVDHFVKKSFVNRFLRPRKTQIIVSTYTCKKFSYYYSEINRCHGFSNCNLYCKRNFLFGQYPISCSAPRPARMIRSFSYGWNRSNDEIDVLCPATYGRSTIYCCDILCGL